MTEKQLYDVINKAEPRGQSVTYKGIPCTARTCVTRLNRLTEENGKLKEEHRRIIDLLDKKLQENDDNDEYARRVKIDLIMELKKELGQ